MDAATIASPLSMDPALLHVRRIAAVSLADAFSEPPCPTPDPGTLTTISAAWDTLREEFAGLPGGSLSLNERSPREIDPNALSAWLALPGNARTGALRQVLGHVVSQDCPPCETEYLPSHDAATRAQHMADLGGFYRAFGVWPDGSHPRRHDHAQFIVGFVCVMLTKLCDSRKSDPEDAAREHTEVCADALRLFLHDHAVWWLPTFARRAEERAMAAMRNARGMEAEALAALGRVAGSLRCWTAVERSATGIAPSRRIVQPLIGGTASDEADCNDCGTCPATPD